MRPSNRQSGAMARPSFSLASFLLRWLVALVLVFATFNPTDYSYYRWVAGMDGGNPAIKADQWGAE